MPYNSVANSFHTKKNFVAASEMQFYTENGRFAVLIPLWGA